MMGEAMTGEAWREDEWLEVLDAEGAPTGVRKRRFEVHRDGDWHRSFHLWVVKEGRTVLVQRRSSLKDLEPGKVDVSVGGHFRAGEGLTEVVREAEEELGLVVSPHELHYLGARRAVRVYPKMIDREVQEVYVMRAERPLEDYFLDCREVAVLYEAPIEGFIALCRHGGYLPVSGFDCQQRANHALLIPDDLIEQARSDQAEVLERILGWLDESAASAEAPRPQRR